MSNKKNSEFSIINKYFKPLAMPYSAALGLDDDCAKISLKEDEQLIVSKDLIVENVHFLKKDGAKKIAAKLLLSNLSDIASSGAKPLYYMLGFSKTKNLNEKFYQDFSKELKEIQDEFDIGLIGGDTVLSKNQLFFSVTIFGIVKKAKNLTRFNAQDQDLIFVSGSIGDSFLGFLQNSKKINLENKNYFLNKHFFPTPRINLGVELSKQNLSKCATDISDGLLADLRQICISSKLSATIFKEKIPFSNEILAIKNKPDFLDLISFGEDYELIFTAKKQDEKKILQLAKKLGIRLTNIGYLEKNKKAPKIKILDKNNQEVKFTKYGYEH